MTANTKMTECRVCKNTFAPNTSQLKKSDFRCLPCRRISDRAYRERRKAEGRPIPRYQLSKEWYRKYWTEYRKRDYARKQDLAYVKMRSKLPSEKHKIDARRQVIRAIKSGLLKRMPCEVCGAIKTHGHHPDYSRQLYVRWLCPLHHSEVHSQRDGGTKK